MYCYMIAALISNLLEMMNQHNFVMVFIIHDL